MAHPVGGEVISVTAKNSMFEEVRRRYHDHLLKPVIHPIIVRRAQGVTVFDSTGKAYLDFTAGFGISILGYNNEYTEYVKEAIYKQIEVLIHNPHYLYYSEPAAALAEKLAELTPKGLTKTFFCNSGSEAVEGAIRTIRKFKTKFELLALQQGFLGRTIGAVSLTGRSEDKEDIGPLLPGVYHIPAPYCYRCSLNHRYPDCGIACANYVEDFLEYGTTGNVAALFFEPILGDAGVIIPPDGYFLKLAEICQQRGIALVADETLTGLGKTGKMFATEHWGLKPEVLVLGKALGGGLPLGAFVVTREVAERFEYKDFSSSTGGNPVACAAGLATIEVIEKENLLERASEQGRYLIGKLEALKRSFNAIGDVRGKGLLIGIEIVNEGSRDAAPEKAIEIQSRLREQGILLTVYGQSTLRLTPPLIIQREHVDCFVGILGSVLKKVTC